jgi:hypothetical protein
MSAVSTRGKEVVASFYKQLVGLSMLFYLLDMLEIDGIRAMNLGKMAG